MKFPPYPSFMQSIQLHSCQVDTVFCRQDSWFTKSSSACWTWGRWLCNFLPLSWCFSLQKKCTVKKCGTKECREGLNIANWSICGRRQKDVCGFDTGWPILIDTWKTILVATVLSTSCDMAKIFVQVLGHSLLKNFELLTVQSTILVTVFPHSRVTETSHLAFPTHPLQAV
jgi:hypothetical protein